MPAKWRTDYQKLHHTPRFEFEPSTGGAYGFGVPLRVDSAYVRGYVILGELTNTSDYTLNCLYAYANCLAEDGSILYWGSGDATTGPYEPGDSDRFSIPIYGDYDCSNFVVTAFGNP